MSSCPVIASQAINPCLKEICHPHALCTYEGPNRHSCTCQEGYHGDGRVCLPVDPCQTNYGNCSAESTVCIYDGPGQVSTWCLELWCLTVGQPPKVKLCRRRRLSARLAQLAILMLSLGLPSRHTSMCSGRTSVCPFSGLSSELTLSQLPRENLPALHSLVSWS